MANLVVTAKDPEVRLLTLIRKCFSSDDIKFDTPIKFWSNTCILPDTYQVTVREIQSVYKYVLDNKSLHPDLTVRGLFTVLTDADLV